MGGAISLVTSSVSSVLVRSRWVRSGFSCCGWMSATSGALCAWSVVMALTISSLRVSLKFAISCCERIALEKTSGNFESNRRLDDLISRLPSRAPPERMSREATAYVCTSPGFSTNQMQAHNALAHTSGLLFCYRLCSLPSSPPVQERSEENLGVSSAEGFQPLTISAPVIKHPSRIEECQRHVRT